MTLRHYRVSLFLMLPLQANNICGRVEVVVNHNLSLAESGYSVNDCFQQIELIHAETTVFALNS